MVALYSVFVDSSGMGYLRPGFLACGKHRKLSCSAHISNLQRGHQRKLSDERIEDELSDSLGEDFQIRGILRGKGTVIYANPTLGMGLAFRDVKPDFRMVMQKWLLAAAQDTFGPKS